GGIVAVDGAEVALSVHQRVAHGEILRQAHDGVVNGGITVRVVFTDDVADDTGRFLVGTIPIVVEFVHGKQDTAMHRLQTISHVGKSTANDHAHGVIEVAAAHLLFK